MAKRQTIADYILPPEALTALSATDSNEKLPRFTSIDTLKDFIAHPDVTSEDGNPLM